MRITRVIIGVLTALALTLAPVGIQFATSAQAQTRAERKSPEEWLKEIERKYGAGDSEDAQDKSAKDSKKASNGSGASGSEPGRRDGIVLEKSKIELPPDQERDVAIRRDAIEKRFTADEIRREKRRIEAEALYREKQERIAYMARFNKVPAKSFGHVYESGFRYRGATQRKERIESGMSIGEYYGGNWKHVPVETALSAVLPARFPRRTHNAEYYNRMLAERYLGKTNAWLNRRQFMRSPNY